MARRLITMFECLNHLHSLAPFLMTREVENKLFAVSSLLWKPCGSGGFILQPYRREDGLGFCLLKNNESLPEGGKALRNFLILKPLGKSTPDGAIDIFKPECGSKAHPNSEFHAYSHFTSMGIDDFTKVFIGSAQSRAFHFGTFIY